MRTLKCAKLDWMKSRSSVKFIIFFIIFAMAIFGMNKVPPVFGIIYVIFGAICVVSTPFFLTGGQAFSIGLPVTTENRVLGRFLFGLTWIFAVSVVGAGMIALVSAIKKEVFSRQDLAMGVAFWGGAIIMMAFQYTMIYLVRIKNQQVMGLVRMVPGFILFFGGSALAEEIQSGQIPAVSTGFLKKTMEWIYANPMAAALALAGVSVVLCFLCAAICCIHEKKRI